jgi:hypothetical protein
MPRERPEDLIDTVANREDFLRFLDALVADWDIMLEREAEIASPFYSASAQGWENLETGHFLDAMRAWARDSTLPPEASWQLFAQLLRAGKSYE